MGFIDFLIGVAKVAFGYVFGGIVFFAGLMAYAQGEDVIGPIIAFVGIIIVLFGIYSEKNL